MGIRPIVSALLHHKTGALLVALQIGVSLAIIVNSVFIIKERLDKINRPTGMDVENIIVVQNRGVGKDYDAVATITDDLAMLRALPGVIDAIAINQVPLSGSGSSTLVRSVPDEKITGTGTSRYRIDDHGLNTLGATLTSGRNFYPEEIEFFEPGKTEVEIPQVVIVSRALADKLYPDGDALGKPVYWMSMEQSTIVGIVGHILGPWPGWDQLDQVLFHPGIRASVSHSQYMIRTEPRKRDELIPVIEEELAKLNPNRVIKKIITHSEVVKRVYENDRAVASVLIMVITLLVGLTALVTAGLVSYFVAQRTRQIGTRRALGATRTDILRYFLVENWIIVALGTVIGAVLTVVVAYELETRFELPHLDYRFLVVAVLLLWALGQVAAILPALRASRISPAIATRTV